MRGRIIYLENNNGIIIDINVEYFNRKAFYIYCLQNNYNIIGPNIMSDGIFYLDPWSCAANILRCFRVAR